MNFDLQRHAPGVAPLSTSPRRGGHRASARSLPARWATTAGKPKGKAKSAQYALTALKALAAWATLWLAAGTAQAQTAAPTDITPASPAQSLSCLQRPERAPSYPQRSRYDRTGGLMRLKLRFDKPDAPPTVEVLANTARENMQDIVRHYVAGYRLPCLTPEDGAVEAVQEFRFNNSSAEPLPEPMAATAARQRLCPVRPAEDLTVRAFGLGNEPQHVVLAMTFAGDGNQPPELKVLYSNADALVQDQMLTWVRGYRMPCRKAGEPAQVVQQVLTMRPHGKARYALKQDSFTLVEFLRMTEKPETLKADFDFDTMHCPFKVNYRYYGAALPSEVSAGRPVDPNRIAFLRWLRERKLDLTERQANDLFSSTLQITVPCGSMTLDPADASPPAALSAASAPG
ncbi:hypothetical protein [Roseateles amylovorans]|uniref:TonB C-terminal domain-containing protein n=1 Tax=Roseateles amylovorans TaxID=2978473 RepID=A0ABY6B1G6_9BURK|nr:hypothetical protein [Roseateles amylovorans]UXH78036.1 hypothetical protein N4261_24270 [Roseateles amylovorans]